MVKYIKIAYLIVITLLLILTLEDCYQVLKNPYHYPFGKEDLGFIYKCITLPTPFWVRGSVVHGSVSTQCAQKKYSPNASCYYHAKLPSL